MKLVLVLSFFFCLINPSISLSEEADKSQSESNIGVKFLFASSASSVIDDVDLVFGSSQGIGINYTYIPSKYLSLELGVATLETDLKVGFNDKYVKYGKLKQTLLHMMARLNDESEYFRNMKMYVGLGLGYFFNDIERSSRGSAEISNFFASNRKITRIDNSAVFLGTLGLEYSLSKKLIFCADINLTATEAKARVEYPDSTHKDGSIAINSIIFGIGLKYNF